MAHAAKSSMLMKGVGWDGLGGMLLGGGGRGGEGVQRHSAVTSPRGECDSVKAFIHSR